jgi:hypothetical protein
LFPSFGNSFEKFVEFMTESVQNFANQKRLDPIKTVFPDILFQIPIEIPRGKIVYGCWNKHELERGKSFQTRMHVAY